MRDKIIQFFLKKLYTIKGFFKYMKMKKGETYYSKLYNCPCVFEGKFKFRLLQQTVEPTYGVYFFDNTRITSVKGYLNIYLFIDKWFKPDNREIIETKSNE